jgi:hypothetical protein
MFSDDLRLSPIFVTQDLTNEESGSKNASFSKNAIGSKNVIVSSKNSFDYVKVSVCSVMIFDCHRYP